MKISYTIVRRCFVWYLPTYPFLKNELLLLKNGLGTPLDGRACVCDLSKPRTFHRNTVYNNVTSAAADGWSSRPDHHLRLARERSDVFTVRTIKTAHGTPPAHGRAMCGPWQHRGRPAVASGARAPPQCRRGFGFFFVYGSVLYARRVNPRHRSLSPTVRPSCHSALCVTPSLTPAVSVYRARTIYYYY